MSDPIVEATFAAGRGELIVLPTDTVYGIGTWPYAPGATSKLFEAKGRPRELELPVLARTSRVARRIAIFDWRATRLSKAFWPGALTLVLPRTTGSSEWDLGGDGATIGVRVPSHPIAQALLAHVDVLACTSANRSGEPTPDNCDQLHQIFGDLVSLYLCDDPLPTGVPSTVVDLTAAEPRFVREGALPTADVLEVLRG